MSGSKHGIVEGGFGGPAQGPWLFGPFDMLVVLFGRVLRRKQPPAPPGL